MELNKLKQISIELNKELSDSMKLHGTSEFSLLAHTIGTLDTLILRLKDNEKKEKKYETL